jgi:proteasome alpha subunit
VQRADRRAAQEGLTVALPYYVSPEQMMADKAEYAKKGIAKGRSIVAMEFADGLLLVADNPSASLHKISEMYDRIAFSGAGKYNEFEMLRKAGIRHADLKGYTYSREDVTARSLANAYSQSIGSIFSVEPKPLEVELLVVEVGQGDKPNEIYRISYDGSIIDEKGVAAIGGKSDALLTFLKARWTAPTTSLREALRLSIESLDTVTNQKLGAEGLEVAVLDRTRTGRIFRRIGSAEIKSLLA